MKRNIVIQILVLILLINDKVISQDQPEKSCMQEELQLRKMQASQILDGLANSIFHVAKITGAKTKKEKAEATLNLVGTVVQFAAEATRKNAKQEEEQPEETNEDQTQQKSDEDNNSIKSAATKSINSGYLEQIQLISSDEEKRDYIATILQDEITTSELINELNGVLKDILFDSMLD